MNNNKLSCVNQEVFRLWKRSFRLGPSVDLASVEPIIAKATSAKSREGGVMTVSMHEHMGRLLLKREGPFVVCLIMPPMHPLNNNTLSSVSM